MRYSKTDIERLIRECNDVTVNDKHLELSKTSGGYMLNLVDENGICRDILNGRTKNEIALHLKGFLNLRYCLTK